MFTLIERFDKTKDYRDLLTPNREKAITRATKIAKKRNIRNAIDYAQKDNNPSTSVHFAIDAIEKLIRKNQSLLP